MKTVSLQEMYRAANEKTLAIWSKNAGIGEVRKENYYDPLKLALATGIQPTVSVKVSRLLCELQQLTQDDPLADILPAHGLHFTFLPLTLPLYNINEPLPANVEQLTTLWTQFDAKKIIIRNLQLVALPGQLLLAGIPEHPAIALRHSFCDKVLETDWKHELLRRHTGSPLPAPFWHSTLLRYSAAFLPATLRQFFLKRQDIDFGDVTGELILARVNYNWTQCYPLRIN
ncbi:hypothetical protein SMC37_000959 [Cronobacter sakazakii]|uniref:hypothetical protein n=1 Tax=Cronobacter sakazakii TaxID=28141 RepID=UPI00025F6C43|nr:hypothetical protein [Cronobacter sakazakii]AFK00418.1 hypothetical protein ES15_2844 [Cronobacter sakazakii ES15]ELY2474252.1 hypothetical protein [Cronobacter sakazakii]ELY2647054.1 hypothetical protein [Cronobacter sakazakii]ELY2731727.1 hypothetical protein [Cronobacter sakazakii]ELY3416682.1 hypothetical protein [Cronobacter sakazakii]